MMKMMMMNPMNGGDNLSDRYLFRGKRLSDGLWIKGSLVIQHDGRCFIFEPCGGLLHEVDPKTVGQYTGMTDKNGKKIFDGDILRVEWTEEYWRETKLFNTVVVVFWDKTLLQWCVRNKTGDLDYYEEEIEVVGNIHDNHELVSGEQSGDSGLLEGSK